MLDASWAAEHLNVARFEFTRCCFVYVCVCVSACVWHCFLSVCLCLQADKTASYLCHVCWSHPLFLCVCVCFCICLSVRLCVCLSVHMSVSFFHTDPRFTHICLSNEWVNGELTRDFLIRFFPIPFIMTCVVYVCVCVFHTEPWFTLICLSNVWLFTGVNSWVFNPVFSNTVYYDVCVCGVCVCVCAVRSRLWLVLLLIHSNCASKFAVVWLRMIACSTSTLCERNLCHIICWLSRSFSHFPLFLRRSHATEEKTAHFLQKLHDTSYHVMSVLIEAFDSKKKNGNFVIKILISRKYSGNGIF